MYNVQKEQKCLMRQALVKHRIVGQTFNDVHFQEMAKKRRER